MEAVQIRPPIRSDILIWSPLSATSVIDKKSARRAMRIQQWRDLIRTQRKNKKVFAYSPLPRNDSIRLLRILHDRNNEPLRCKIFHTRLNKAKSYPYAALSYVWGDPTPCCPIRLNDKAFSVPKNAFEALSNLRKRHDDMVIWIDAVCIDQKASDEKSRQVALMARIYQNANRVIAWLGADFEGSKGLFGAFDAQADALKFDNLEVIENPNILDQAANLTTTNLRAFSALGAKAWFSR